MNRRFLFRLSTIVELGLALIPGSVVAQQRAHKHQPLGAWSLVSAECIGEALVGRAVRAGGNQMVHDLQFPMGYSHEAAAPMVPRSQNSRVCCGVENSPPNWGC